jgi:hypothetical protein
MRVLDMHQAHVQVVSQRYKTCTENKTINKMLAANINISNASTQSASPALYFTR